MSINRSYSGWSVLLIVLMLSSTSVALTWENISQVYSDFTPVKMSSALNQHNSTEWRFTYNQTNLEDGTYTYYGWANDTSGNIGQSETRTVNVHLNPVLEFKNPTPTNNSFISTNHTQINISVYEPHLDEFRFQWNSTNYTFLADAGNSTAMTVGDDNSLVLAMAFNNMSAVGECYDNETEILTRKELTENEIIELMKNSGGRVRNYQELGRGGVPLSAVRNETEILTRTELTESDIQGLMALVDNRGDTSNPSSSRTIKYPSKSSGVDLSLSNPENARNKASGLSWGILSQTTEKTLSPGKETGSVKSSSFVTNTLCSDLEYSANLPFETPFGLNIASTPCCLRNCSNSFFTFSSSDVSFGNEELANLRFASSRNFSSVFFDTNDDIVTTSGDDACIMQSCLNMLFCEGCYETCNYLFNRDSALQHLQYLPDHNPGSLKSGFSMADFTVCDNIPVDFNSHDIYWVRKDLNTLNIPHCQEIQQGFCQQDGRFYRQEWKHFRELDGTEKVATLNPETGETEFHKPWRYQVYEHDSFMYKIETEQGDLLVSPEHKVFGMIDDSDVVPNSQPEAEANPKTNADLIKNALVNERGFDKIQLTEIGTQNMEKTNADWNSNPSAGGEILPALPATAAGDSGKMQKPGMETIDSVYADYGFSADDDGSETSETSETSELPAAIKHPDSIKHSDSIKLKLDEFRLLKISDVYDEYYDEYLDLDGPGGKGVVFLDANLETVKVNSIKKVPYSGRIYDVTVDNHIILVRRIPPNLRAGWLERSGMPPKVSSAAMLPRTSEATGADFPVVWSGNSYSASSTGEVVYDYSGLGNNGTTGNAITYNSSAGKFGGAFQFDGVNDYILVITND